jgi:hypothetical protein
MMGLLLVWMTLAADPTVAFTVEDGFVTARVKRDGQPIVGAILKVYDGGSGPPLVEGETGDDGQGLFVLPNNAGLVGITIDGKECDLIPLKVDGNSITPPRVLLTFGTRPCCIVVTKADKEGPEATMPPYLLYALLGLGVVVMTLTAILVSRGDPPTPNPTQ